jgi:hypothetical protein
MRNLGQLDRNKTSPTVLNERGSESVGLSWEYRSCSRDRDVSLVRVAEEYRAAEMK